LTGVPGAPRPELVEDRLNAAGAPGAGHPGREVSVLDLGEVVDKLCDKDEIAGVGSQVFCERVAGAISMTASYRHRRAPLFAFAACRSLKGRLAGCRTRGSLASVPSSHKWVRLRPLVSFEGSGDLCPARNGRVDTALPAISLAMSGLGLLPCVC
jgi:hypothetical protein